MPRKLKFCIDSGAFSAFTLGKPVNVETYTKFCLDHAQDIDHVVNLDYIDPANPENAAATGWNNLLYMRDKGVVNPVPVYHARESIKWFDKMLSSCEYIGLSGTSIVSTSEHMSFYDHCFHYGTDAAGKPIAKYHAFGDTAPESLLTFPWYSVEKDSLILIRQAGRVRVDTIEELFWSSTEPVEFLSKSGSSKRRKLLQVETLVPVDGKCLWAPVESVIRHEISKPLFEVVTRRGKRVRLTDDHGLYVSKQIDDLEGSPVTIKDLKVRESRIISPQPSRESLRGASPILNSVTITLELQIQKIGTGKNKYFSKKIPVTIDFDSQLLEYLGLWIADGSVNGGSVDTSAANDEECKHLLYKVADVFKRKLTLSKNGVDSSISSPLLATIIQKLLEKDKFESHTKEMPWWVFQLSDSDVGSLLRGYFSGDGSVEADSVTMTTVSSKLSYAVYFLLTSLGMRCICDETEEQLESIGDKTYVCRPSYKVQILDKASLVIFKQKVGFLQARKNERLEKIILSKSDTPVFTVDGKIRRDRSVRDPKIEEVELVRVEKIKNLGKKNRFVYDISVPVIEKFVANGLVIHNSCDSATWMIAGGRAGSIRLNGKTYRLRSKKVHDRNYISSTSTGVEKQSWEDACRELGLKPEAVMNEEMSGTQLAMIRGYMVVADLLKLRERTIDVTHFKKPSRLFSNKRQQTGGYNRTKTIDLYTVVSPTAYYFNLPVVAALKLEHILVSYFYITRERPDFFDKLVHFMEDPIGFCETDPKASKMWDMLNKCLLNPVERESKEKEEEDVVVQG